MRRARPVLRKPHPLPEVERLLSKYKPRRRPETSRPAERGLLIAVELDAFFSAHAGPEVFADPKLQTQLRNLLFKQEAWLRLYRPAFGKRFEKSLARVKELEDLLGTISLWREMLALGVKTLPAEVVGWFEEQERVATKRLRKLVQRHWLPDPDRRGQVPEIDRLAGRILDAEFGSHEEDAAWLKRRLGKHVHSILRQKIDFRDLQGGIHELRRELRWLPLSFQALWGAVLLSERDNPVPALAKLLKAPEAKSPYIAITPSPRETHPIVISKSIVVANSRTIDTLGRIKEAGEHVEYLAVALENVRAARGPRAEKVAREHLGPGHDEADVFDAAKRVWRDFDASGALRALLATLEASS